MIVDSCHNRVSADQCHMTVSRAHWGDVFLKLSAYYFSIVPGKGPFLKEEFGSLLAYGKSLIT